MIKHVKFPASINESRYYQVHVKYIIETAKSAGITISCVGNTSVGNCKFKANVDGKEVIFDFSNHIDVYTKPDAPCFKFQYSISNHKQYKHLFPFTKVSFYDWNQYNLLSKNIKYSAGNIISCRQRPYAGAKERRMMVQKLLHNKYGNQVATSIINQNDYWKEVNSCLVGIFVPGARNDILDRGHIQYMALGCCTISPEIIDIFPFNKLMIPGKHYIVCKSDYSDLCDKIDWAASNREECIKIGNNAKNLFLETSTPQKLWQWVEQCIGNLYA